MRQLDSSAWFTERELHDVEPPPFLVEGVLPMRSVNMLFGEFNIGKTFIALDMAGHISIGKWWLGRPTEQADVLYIASEGDPGNMGVRMDGWRKFHSVTMDMPMLFYADIVDLKNQAKALVDEAIERGLRPRLIVVDTLSMALTDNENDNQVMNDLIKSLRGIQTYTVDDVEYEISWLIIHHTGWEKGRPRGGSSMPAGLDYVFGLEAETEQTVKLFHYKAKNSAKFAPIHFKQVEVGETIVYEKMDSEEAKKMSRRAKDTDRAGIEDIFEKWLELVVADEDTFGQKEFCEYAAAGLKKDPATLKSNVSNMFKDYVEDGTIEQVNRYTWKKVT